MITGLGVCPAGMCPFKILGLEVIGAAMDACCTGAETDTGALDPSTAYQEEKQLD